MKFGGAVKVSSKLEECKLQVLLHLVVSLVTGNVTGTATLATDLAINGTNQIVYQDSNNDSDVLPTGSAGQILASSGAGAEPQWVTSAPAGAIEGITIRDESSIVGTANSISTIKVLYGSGIAMSLLMDACQWVVVVLELLLLVLILKVL